MQLLWVYVFMPSVQTLLNSKARKTLSVWIFFRFFAFQIPFRNFQFFENRVNYDVFILNLFESDWCTKIQMADQGREYFCSDIKFCSNWECIALFGKVAKIFRYCVEPRGLIWEKFVKSRGYPLSSRAGPNYWSSDFEGSLPSGPATSRTTLCVWVWVMVLSLDQGYGYFLYTGCFLLYTRHFSLYTKCFLLHTGHFLTETMIQKQLLPFLAYISIISPWLKLKL